MAEKRGGLSVIQGLRTVLEVQIGADWHEVDGVGSMSYTAGERGEAQVNAWQGSRSLLGPIPATAVSFPITAYMPGDWVWGQLYDAWINNTNLQFRVTTPEDKLFPSGDAAMSGARVTAAIAMATGIVTLAGEGADFTGEDIQRGAVIKIGEGRYSVRSIDLDDNGGVNQIIVRPFPANDVAAAQYSVVLPSVRIAFGARVRQTNSMEIGADEGSVLASTLSLQPAGPLPRGQIV